MTHKIRVLLADDHRLVREGLWATLGKEKGLVLVGEAGDGQTVQQLSLELRPDVLLLDLSMPGPSPAETMAYLRAHCPEVKIIILTVYDDLAYIRRFLQMGARGYILKDDSLEAIGQAIQVVARGGSWLSLRVMEKLTDSEAAGPVSVEAGRPEIELTERERRLLRLIGQGCNNHQIAVELNLAKQTTRNYISRLYRRLGVNSRVAAAQWADKYLGKL